MRFRTPDDRITNPITRVVAVGAGSRQRGDASGFGWLRHEVCAPVAIDGTDRSGDAGRVSETDGVPAFAGREVGVVAGLVGAALLGLSGRYGYHRDELYFLAAGHHLAWGYPDQPPLVPLLARAMDTVAPGSVVVLRLPSTLLAMVIVGVAALVARGLGARRSGQVAASAATGLCGFVLGTGHLLSTSTFSLLGWTLCTWLLVRLLTGRAGIGGWLALGLVAGVTVQANPLVLALVAAFGIAVLLAGPRDLFKSIGPYAAVAVTVAIGSPYLVWQARHGCPQLTIAHSIAQGGSGSSASRWAFIPFQLLQVGPWLSPLWIAGLIRLWRERTLRSLAVTYLVLVVMFLIGGGKPYYLSGLYPLLFAAGAQPLIDHVRRWVVPALLVASAPVLLIVLPVLPAHDAGPVVAVNYDAGETIGWPRYVDQIATAYRGLPKGTAILTENYGEAGAVDRYGPAHRLPKAHSGHNAYGLWGPPPGSVPVLAIGVPEHTLRTLCGEVQELGKLHSTKGIDNDENGTPMMLCTTPIEPWQVLWPKLKHLD
jgi:hypothetical protein